MSSYLMKGPCRYSHVIKAILKGSRLPPGASVRCLALRPSHSGHNVMALILWPYCDGHKAISFGEGSLGAFASKHQRTRVLRVDN